ncbi:hypothetical protein [uncultured Tateyamaria sp.]|uniref:hypothetical protein n=1 Tax=uncultured Tateyamaria sp. TaxID=455651 RepID=UPI0026354A5A|nr:hypothetical protein [uncultured Tateyamaria sp.]
MKISLSILTALCLAACGSSSQNDPIYLALKADPPTEIPDRHVAKLRQGRFSCDVFNEGRSDQYMTCWWPQDGLRPVQTAYMSYFGPNPISPPEPSKLVTARGTLIVERIPVK